MLASWTAEVVGRLHRIGADKRDLAKESGYNYSYVSLVLNGHRDSDAAQERIMQALERLEARARQDDVVDSPHEQEAQECDHD